MMKTVQCIKGGAYYRNYLEKLQSALENMMATDRDGASIEVDAALLYWCSICQKARNLKKTMYFIGNGASATMASHMAADFSKNCQVSGYGF